MRVLATLILITASRAWGADFDDLLRRAADARRAGDAGGTLSLLREAYQVRPIPELLNNIGRTLEDLGRYDEAAVAYARVLDDPATKPPLVELDRQRLAVLRPKLEEAWLEVTSPDARAFLDGDPIAVGRETEIPVGPHLLELSQGRRAVLVFFTAVRARRIDVDRRPEVRLEHEAVLSLEPTARAPEIRALFVNDRPIRSPLAQLSIALPAGSYRIRAETEAGPQAKLVRIGEGRALALGRILDPIARRELPRERALSLRTPSAAHAGPIVLGSAALLAGGAGALLFALAQANRGTVRRAATDRGGVVVGLSMIEAVRLRARANEEATAAVVGFSGAGALAAGAVLWWILGADVAPARLGAVAAPGSVGLDVELDFP